MLEKTRTALVTGANRGLGLATATELHRRDIRVLLAGRGNGPRDAAAELGRGATALEMDVTDPRSIQHAANEAGHVDILVSNAGVLLDTDDDPLSVPIETLEETLAVNLLGSWRVAQAFVPSMVRRGWGRVVFISSATGAFSVGLYPKTSAYSVSKAALNGMTTMLAAQTHGSGVLVNAVNPGRTQTRMVPNGPRTASEAAVDIAHAATLPDNGHSGAFMRGEKKLDW